MPPVIRPARLEEADALTALTHRSKAHWGYDAAFMLAARDALTISPSAIAAGQVWVAEDRRGKPLGVASLAPLGEGVWDLATLFVDPPAIGGGVGAALLRRMADTARGLGGRTLVIVADPNAAAFYEKMGAAVAGEEPSDVIPGRRLPRYELKLREGD